jgi:hypothetical protein
MLLYVICASSVTYEAEVFHHTHLLALYVATSKQETVDEMELCRQHVKAYLSSARKNSTI